MSAMGRSQTLAPKQEADIAKEAALGVHKPTDGWPTR